MSHQPLLTPVREAHRFDESALSAYMEQKLGPEYALASVQQYEGGQSNPTFRLITQAGPLVLRKQPPGDLLPSAHALDREFRVMASLKQSGVPVPQMLDLCLDKSIIGTMFLLMAEVPGRVVADPAMPGFPPQQRRALMRNQIEVLARLHGTDLVASGLADFGRPGDYYLRQITRWSKQYRASQTEDIAAMEFLLNWLPVNRPQEESLTLVHGDYRIGNFILARDRPEIAAVLDWELSTLGDPLSDLAYWCLPYHYNHGQTAPVAPGEDSGIPEEQVILDWYHQLTGRDPGRDWPFYMAFTMFRLAAIIQGVVRRGLDGNASSQRWPSLARDSRKLAELAVSLCESA